MPIKRCTKDNKSGWKYGDSGTCFTGKDAKERARKQGIAINLEKQRRGEKPEWSKAEFECSPEEFAKLMAETDATLLERSDAQIAFYTS